MKMNALKKSLIILSVILILILSTGFNPLIASVGNDDPGPSDDNSGNSDGNNAGSGQGNMNNNDDSAK